MARPIPVTHHLPTDMHIIDMTDLVSTISLFLKHLEHRAKNNVKMFWHMPPPHHCLRGLLTIDKEMFVSSHRHAALRLDHFTCWKHLEPWDQYRHQFQTSEISGLMEDAMRNLGEGRFKLKNQKHSRLWPDYFPSRGSTSPNTHNFPFPSSWTKKDPNCERKVMALNWFGFQMRTASADLYLFLIFLLEP